MQVSFCLLGPDFSMYGERVGAYRLDNGNSGNSVGHGYRLVRLASLDSDFFSHDDRGGDALDGGDGGSGLLFGGGGIIMIGCLGFREDGSDVNHGETVRGGVVSGNVNNSRGRVSDGGFGNRFRRGRG